MNLFEQLGDFIGVRFAFPAVNYILNSPDILKTYRELAAEETYSETQRKELQFGRFCRLLNRVYQWIPFYRERFRAAPESPDLVTKSWLPPYIPPRCLSSVVK